MQRIWIGCILLVGAFYGVFSPSPARAEPRCFPEVAPAIQHCIDGRFRSYWEAQGGLPVFGYPISGEYQVQTGNGNITVQQFERVRMELHPTNAPPHDVLLSHLGKEALIQQGWGGSPPQAPRDGCRFFEQTGQNLCSPFLDTWQSYGLDFGHPGVSAEESIALFGLPLTPATPTTDPSGASYTVQWFERARFEDHGEQGVLLGLLGREVGTTPPANTGGTSGAVPPWQNPYGPQQPGGFIEVSGSELVRLGQPIRLKGINYYPQWRPWTDMWDRWNAPQIERELQLAKEQLGVNAVRILLPYGVSGDGVVDASLIRKLREMCQIAGRLEMRLIVTLFDFYEDFPDAGGKEERKNKEYLERLIGNFAGDERIFAWDVHNEPDHYKKWADDGKADEVLSWLGRMADEIHRLAPHHLVTVGMGQYHNLWQPGPDGRTVLDYSDIISVHIYNADDAARQLDEVRKRTQKPIIVQEFGWPSGPPCVQSGFDEAEQTRVYQEIIAAAEGRAVGVFAWTLRDYDAGPTMRWDTPQEHYGLYRPDDSLKPAGWVFREYVAPPLPNTTTSDYELTPDRGTGETGEKAPLFIDRGDGSGYYVKSWFRRAWDHLGGQGSFGKPLSEAFVRPEDGKIVQYFEAAVLELNEDKAYGASFPNLTEPEKVMKVIRPASIGRTFVRGHTVAPPTTPPPPNSRHFPDTGYSVTGEFWSLYENLLGPWRFGSALSNQVSEDVDGVVRDVQYFERGRIERNPVDNGIIPGQLGRWAWNERCNAVQ